MSYPEYLTPEEKLAAARAGDAPWIKAYGEDIEQARQGEAEAVRAREAAEAEVKRLTAKLTAAQAENDGLAECMRNTDRLTTAEATELRTRAERAEATLTAVRKAVARGLPLAKFEMRDEPSDEERGWASAMATIEAALGDPQPATEAEHEHGWAPATCRRMNTRTCPPTGPCPGPCARFESDDPTPWEQPAEPPTVNVIDALAAALVAAGRRILRGDTP